jgi:hypothetical protein
MKFVPIKPALGSYIATITNDLSNYTFAKKVDKDTYAGLEYFCTCSDFLTDILLGNRVIGYTGGRVEEATVLAYIPKDVAIFKANLHLLHDIEKANHFKRTKLFEMEDGKTVVLEGSALWQSSTFALSLYSKLLRNLDKAVIYTDRLLDINFELPTTSWEFLSWIMYNGKILKVNYGLEFVHGCFTATQVLHSNNGVIHTINAFFVIKTKSYYFDYFKNCLARFDNLMKLYTEMQANAEN